MQCEEEKHKVIKAGDSTFSGPSDTSPDESTTSYAVVPASGRPGSSRFYLSLEDDLMRIFGGERVKMIMESVGMEEGVPIEHTVHHSSHRKCPEKSGSPQL